MIIDPQFESKTTNTDQVSNSESSPPSIRLESTPAYELWLPAYSPTNPIVPVTSASASISNSKVFTMEIERKNKTMAVMTIAANRDFSKTLPTFIEGQPIRGTLKIDLEQRERFQEIVICVSSEIFDEIFR